MNVLIIEDSIESANTLTYLLKENIMFDNAQLFYNTGYMENIDYSIEYFLIFIDIYLGDVNGIELSKSIKLKCPNAIIVFVTINEDLVFNSLEIQPFYFIRKKHMENDVHIFLKLLQEYISKNQLIVFSLRGEVVKLHLNKILYIEAQGHYLKIHTINDEYKQKKKLSDIKQQIIYKNFVQIHRSYLINMDYIYKILNNYVILINKKEINIGKKYKNEFKKIFQEYLVNGGL